MGDLELLRMHVEAGWGVRLPPLASGDNECLPDHDAAARRLLPSGETGWTVYAADVADEYITIWRPEVPAAARPALRAQALAALASAEDVAGVTREVALHQTAAPTLGIKEAGMVARRLVEADRDAVREYEPGEEAYYLDEPARQPVVGAFDEGGRLVAIAHSSRRTARACELGVGTLSDARRRGYGLAVTVLWAAAVAAEGLVPLYSALATNTASLALAHASGYRSFARAAYVSA
jgi:GNAT acetyltransferase-like protein